MIVFLYGPETFLSKRKLNEIIAKKTEQSRAFNVYRLAEGGFDLSELKEILKKISIFENKKIIVMENVFKGTPGKIGEIGKFIQAEKIIADANNLLIFWDEEIDEQKKKTLLFKILTAKEAVFQSFDNLAPAQLKKWIAKEVQAREGKISAPALEFLALSLDKDLWRLDREIDKLIAYRKGEVISADDVKLLVAADLSSNIFDLVDALGRKDSRRSISIFYSEIRNGRDELEILGMIAGHFRKLMSVRALMDSGLKASTPALGFHPFVFRKALEQSRNFSLSDLKNKFKRIAETDFFIKTGKTDKRTGLEMLIFSLGQG